MGFEPWSSLFVPILNWPGRWEVYPVLAIYVVSILYWCVHDATFPCVDGGYSSLFSF